MTKLLSIIVPSYNMERYLDKAIGSLIVGKKWLPLLDIIIVNDGSKDKTLEIARKYEEAYSTAIRVVDKKNGNYGSCINVGLELAWGQYIKILDADDTFISDNFQRLLEKLSELTNKNQQVDMIITDTRIVDENGKTTGLLRHNLVPDKVNSLSAYDINHVLGISHHSVIFRTEILRKIDYKQMEGVSYSDQEWVTLPFFAVDKYYYMPLEVYSYLLGRQGQTMEKSALKKNAKVRLEIKKHMLEFYESNSKKYDLTHQTIVAELITSQIIPLYEEYLLLYRKELDNQEIIAFDSYLLSKHKYFYDILDDTKYNKLPFKYIRMFRGNYNTILYKSMLLCVDGMQLVKNVLKQNMKN